jgi:ribosome biogenesis GTPase
LSLRILGVGTPVKTIDGKTIESKIKGNFRLKGIRSTNPVAVGDYVEIDVNQEGTAFITSIEDRRKLYHPQIAKPLEAKSYHCREC